MLSWRLRWYRAALAWATLDFRTRFRDEAVGALAMALASERDRRGRLAEFRLWVRAMGDAMVSVVRERRGGGSGGLAADLKLAVRSLRRSPQYAIVMIATLALSIGGVAAVFTLADPMLFRALPYRDADRLVRVDVSGKGTFGGFNQAADFLRLQASGVFDAAMTFTGPFVGRSVDLADDADPVLGYQVTDGFFDTLGVSLAMGRTFSEDEYSAAPGHYDPFDRWQGAPVLITDQLWSRAFRRRDDVVGGPLRVTSQGREVTLRIVGILRPDFVLPDATNEAPLIILPEHVDRATEGSPRNVVAIFGRLKPGATLESTTVAMAGVMSQVERDYPALPQNRTVALVGLRDLLFQRIRVPILMLLIVTAAVLVLAIINLTHLALARAGGRVREVALRGALGASRWRIVRLLLVESLLLATIGGIAAAGVGKMLFEAVMAALPTTAHLYRLMPAHIDGRVLALIALLAGLSVVMIGLLPALLTTRRDLSHVLQSEARNIRGRRRWGTSLLTGLQAGASAAILVVTVLVTGSFVRLMQSVTGIDETGLATGYIEWPSDYQGQSQRMYDIVAALADGASAETGQAIGRVGGIPGLTLPGGLWTRGAGADAKAVAVAYPADLVAMRAFRLELIAGRMPTDEEVRQNAPVVIVDERAASLIAPGGDALGALCEDAQIRGERAERRVIGVVRHVDLSFGKPLEEGKAFVPIDPRRAQGPNLLWRGRAAPRVLASLREHLRALEPRARFSGRAFVPFERRFGEPKLLALVTGVLGVLALILTIAGAFSVTNHAVSGRTPEIGVRMALGATAERVRGMVVRETLWPAVIGVVAGLGAAALWVKAIATLLFQVTTRDPLSYALSGALVIGVVALAAVIPAARASRTNPVEALRAE
jgi:predicted permease